MNSKVTSSGLMPRSLAINSRMVFSSIDSREFFPESLIAGIIRPNSVAMHSILGINLLFSGFFGRKSTRAKRDFTLDGHPITAHYVRVRHATRHLKRSVTPHAPVHNERYRTPGLSSKLCSPRLASREQVNANQRLSSERFWLRALTRTRDMHSKFVHTLTGVLTWWRTIEQRPTAASVRVG